jgi:hypothetical protein
MQGPLLEKFLTQSPDEFIRLTRSTGDSSVMDKEPGREAYRYAKVVFRFILLYFRVIPFTVRQVRFTLAT